MIRLSSGRLLVVKETVALVVRDSDVIERCLAKSFLVSADIFTSTRTTGKSTNNINRYFTKAAPNNANQRYATTALTAYMSRVPSSAAFLSRICRKTTWLWIHHRSNRHAQTGIPTADAQGRSYLCTLLGEMMWYRRRRHTL